MTVVPFRTAQDHACEAPAAAAFLRNGGLLAYPTETVYGLGCGLHPAALAALARLKQREPTKPFLLLVRDAGGAEGLTWTPSARVLAEAFWPGPLTLIVPARAGAYPEGVVANGAVALRATPHPGMRAILARFGGPLTSTSANAPGRPPATSVDEVVTALSAMAFGDEVRVLDGGALPPSPSSTIVDCVLDRPRLVRAGAVQIDELRTVVRDMDD